MDPEYKNIARIPPDTRKALSVIIPVYNEGAMLQLTVLSLLQNTEYPDFEIIVCDQGSTDGCCDFLNWPRFKSNRNLCYLDCADSNGPNTTRNAGIRHARGEFLLVLDGHMAVEPGWADRLLLGWLNFDNVGLVGSNIPDINNWNSRRYRYVYTTRDLGLFNKQVRASHIIGEHYAESPNIPGGCSFMSRTFFEASGGFDEGMRGWGFNDVEFSMRAWLLGYRCIMVTDLHISHYYKQPGHTTFKVNLADYQYNRLRHLYTNFTDQTLRERILKVIGNDPHFQTAQSRIETDEAYHRFRQRQQAKYKRDDLWWCRHFKHYLSDDFSTDKPADDRVQDGTEAAIAGFIGHRDSMDREEYRRVAEQIRAHAPCRLLVFGLGADSTFWNGVNKDGETVFLDNRPARIAQHTDVHAVRVAYGTRLEQWQSLLNTPQQLTLSLPNTVRESRWDVILVNGPEGVGANAPGRMKSIYTAWELATQSEHCVVFVQGCNREMEAHYCDAFFGTNYQQISSVRKYNLNANNTIISAKY